jgi:hypothetical protein
MPLPIFNIKLIMVSKEKHSGSPFCIEIIIDPISSMNSNNNFFYTKWQALPFFIDRRGKQ